MEENQFTNEILSKIENYFENEKILEIDIFQIIMFCQSALNNNINKTLISKDFNFIKKEMKLLNLNKVELLQENIEELPPGVGETYVEKFLREQLLKKYGATLDLRIGDIEESVRNNIDLDIFFAVSGGQLKIHLGKDDGSFKDSSIQTVFDEYSKKNNPNNHYCPKKITIPISDLKDVYTYLSSSTSAKAYLKTAVSLSDKNDYKGRVIVVLICDTGSKTIKYYDTFKLCPPDGAC